MNFILRLWICMLLCGVAAFASTVLEDSPKRFVLKDEVLDSEPQGCTDDIGRPVEGMRFIPENATYLKDGDVPYRFYRIALPNGNQPNVAVSVESRVALKGKPCAGQQLASGPVSVGKPFLKDGLWIVDVGVPLYEGSRGGTIQLRKSFKLQVDFVGAGAGKNPGPRALSRVVNPKAGARFGEPSESAQKALRRSAPKDLQNVKFLAEFLIGDKNIATMSEDGLYAVDYATIKNALPFQYQNELDGISISKLCVFGASPDTLGDIVPGKSELVPSRIFEIPIEVRDHSKKGAGPADGTFNDGDSILFIGYGTSFWKSAFVEDPLHTGGKMDYFHSSSPYSYYQHFQFGYKTTGNGIRLDQTLKTPNGSGKDISWMRYVRGEKDLLLRDSYYEWSGEWESGTGKEWFWAWHSRKDTSTLSSSELITPETSNLPGLIAGTRQYLGVSFFPYRSVWAADVGGEDDQVPDLELSTKSYEERMDGVNFNFKVNGKTLSVEDFKLMPGHTFWTEKAAFQNGGNAYSLTMLPNDKQFDRFDGYTVAYQWNPVIDTSAWLLPGRVSGVIRIPVNSDVNVLKFVNMEPKGLLSVAGGYAKDTVSALDDVRYLAYKKNVYLKTIQVQSSIANVSGALTDLSQIDRNTEYLIVAPQEFLDAAVALKKFRMEGSAVTKIPTTVVSVADIYRNYTAGTLSPAAIRNYIAYAYSVCPKLRYVLLAGSGHFDYRGNNSRYAKNFIPPFEMESSVTEDYYAVLDSGEFVRNGSYDLDVAVGRLPVSTPLEFANYLEKVKDYEQMGGFDHSNWRSNLLMSADDAKNGPNLDYTQHTVLQESIAALVDSLSAAQKAQWRMRKIYLLDYAEDAGGKKKDATENFLSVMNQGALITTYFGHGSMTEWASEGLLKPSYLSKLSNRGRYTILGSFSCTVGRFDKGDERSLSEEFMIANKVGSIASVGATRETFAKFNEKFGKNFVLNMLKTSGVFIGDAFVAAKGREFREFSRQRNNDENYVLIGEPVIQMPRSDLKVSLDQSLDTLKALDKMKLSGQVQGLGNGNISLSIREGRYAKRLFLGLEDMDPDSLDVSFEGSLIYSEEIPVKNGRFETEFITPRKLAFGDTAAELTAWAYSKDNPKIGRMLRQHISISGVSSYADSIKDDVPPSIQIQSCYGSGYNTGFADGQSVKLQAPACLQIVVEDSTAIDYREEADEGISFEVVGVGDPFHPWPYLEQNSRKAVVRMIFASATYPEGKYLFKVKAHDVLGNASVKTLNLEITEDMKSGLEDVFNVPNPMGKKGTTFYFKNLAVDRTSAVDIFIYNQHGRLVKVIRNAISGKTHWDGRDNFGRLLANGLYHYVVRSNVEATEDFKRKTWTKKQKLLISR